MSSHYQSVPVNEEKVRNGIIFMTATKEQSFKKINLYFGKVKAPFILLSVLPLTCIFLM